MTYEHIKEGDTVMFHKPLGHSLFGLNEYFWVPREVTRVTPARFELDRVAGQFRKTDGYCYGGGYARSKIALVGEVPLQLQEHNDYLNHIQEYSLALKNLERIQRDMTIENGNLSEIAQHLTAIRELL